MADPVTRPLLQDEGTMCAWYGADRKIVLYATSYNTLLNFVCIHPASSSEDSDDYNKTASKSRLLEVYAGFHPAVISLLEKVGEDQVSLYTLYDMEQLPTFVTGLMALIGDAAHPFTPHLAQGGAMAIEDGLSLGTMLPLGTLPEEVQVRLQLYNQARHERASKIQEYSRIVGGDSAKAKSTSGASLAVHEFIDYGLSHDEYYASRQILRKHLWKQPSSQQRWRSPLGFGLLQGPRQDLHGRSHAASLKKSASRHASIQFATSASVLRGLFPSDRYTFMSRDTVQHVTLDLQTLDNMSWLGGQGYDLVALYIHGVCYQEADGTLVQGKYCPIMIENLADPIITGPEEVGIPKVFSDIEITETETSVPAIVSWRGAQWLQLEWSQLSNASVDTEVPAPGREGILVHKYVPSTAKPGTADVEYAVLIDSTVACSRALSRQECLPSNATVSFSSPGAKALPTLCNIAEALAELPVCKSLQASVLKVEGVSDFSNLTVLH
ncbi:hypothetical protein LTR12_018148 [Friedmanniomyces endolithicus]|nr:hypothetical protein LTR12_018148 [Friedmanniomyces endolithicus]